MFQKCLLCVVEVYLSEAETLLEIKKYMLSLSIVLLQQNIELCVQTLWFGVFIYLPTRWLTTAFCKILISYC